MTVPAKRRNLPRPRFFFVESGEKAREAMLPTVILHPSDNEKR
jgi:hypothetical protein